MYVMRKSVHSHTPLGQPLCVIRRSVPVTLLFQLLIISIEAGLSHLIRLIVATKEKICCPTLACIACHSLHALRAFQTCLVIRACIACHSSMHSIPSMHIWHVCIECHSCMHFMPASACIACHLCMHCLQSNAGHLAFHNQIATA